MRSALVLLLAVLLPSTAAAEGPAARAAPSLSLRSPAQITPAPVQGGDYTLRARFAAAASSGELREGDRFALIGRIAKGNPSCSSEPLVFRNGFEAP